PRLDSAGVKLRQRLSAVLASLDRLNEWGGLPRELLRLRHILHRGLAQTESLWPAVQEGFKWVYRVAGLLANKRRRRGKTLARQVGEAIAEMTTQAQQCQQHDQNDVARALR